MNLEQIKHFVDNGHRVHWLQENYIVECLKDEYVIRCTNNNHVIGLTWQDGKTLNGQEADFYYINAYGGIVYL